MKKLLPLSLLLGLVAAPSAAQIKMDFAGGAGFMFSGEEDQAFDAKSLYGAFHWNGLELPGPSVSTGIGIEFHPATVVVDGTVLTVDYRVWSLNRFDCPGRLFCIADLKIGQGGEGGWASDFDERVGFGMLIAKQERFEINMELYFLEDDRPIAALMAIRFGGSNQP